jgi:L-threonylcarbamoyladenylate synthase
MKGKQAETIPMTVDGDINAAVRRAAGVLLTGGVILYPTDTIYGLGCRASDEAAIGRIYAIKERPETRPSLVLVGSAGMVGRFVTDIPPIASRLMEKFWPGPLTLLFRASGGVSPMLTAGTGKIGIRLPAQMFCMRVAERCDDALVSTSANLTGVPPGDDPAGLAREFGMRVDLVVDAGRLPSLPSTVADISGGELLILREGAIPGRDLASALVSGP